MEINFFGKKTLASLIIVSVVNFIKFRFKQFEIDEITLWKIYYEFQKFVERTPLKKISSEKEFIELLIDVLKIFENYFEINLKKDPDYIKKLMKKKSYLWSIYKFFSNFADSNGILRVINSPISKEIQSQINKKIIKTPELLDYKVKRDIDYVIQDYEKLEIPKPINMTNEVILKDLEKKPFSDSQKQIVKDAVYTETPPDGSNAQSILGGEMRIQFKQENNE